MSVGLIAAAVVGWTAAIGVVGYHVSVARKIRQRLRRKRRGTLFAEVDSFASEAERYVRAALSFSIDENVRKREIGGRLQQILLLVREELDAHAVELSLSDKDTGVSSQIFLVGVPKSSSTQSMLDGEQKEQPGIVKKQIVFAGTVFGTLRIEMKEGKEFSRGDGHLLDLLAVQVAVALLNAKFTEEFLRMKRLGDESLQAKTGFLANLSHEIRGPLGIILNGVELALDGLCGPLSENLKETLSMIKDSGHHLLDLVNDVLDYAKVEAGKVTAKPVELHVRALLDDLLNVVRSQAETKRHKLVCEPIDATLGMVCDKRHARQMLINFLTNAIKYTPEGGTITVRAERFVGGKVKISIADTGIGIPESQRSKVFGAFERVDDKYAQSQVGTGLGMPLTLRLAEANGGTVDFESSEGAGSTFWLIMPACEMKAPETAYMEQTGQKMRFGNGESLLLVDPDPESREMLKLYLSDQGFQMFTAATGKEVMKILKERPVDVAIIENDLPDLSGEEMVAAIRSHPRASSLPVVLLSSRAFVFDIERFLKLGVDRCLSKPIELSELSFTARRLIDESRSVSARV